MSAPPHLQKHTVPASLRPTLSAFRHLIPLALAASILLLPVHVALAHLDLAALQPVQLVGSLALLLLLALLPSLMPLPVAVVLMAITLAFMLIVRLWFFGLVQFSGAGFTDDVFIHLEFESIQVAWDHYRLMFLALLVLLGLVPLLTFYWARRMPRARPSVALALMLLAGAGIVMARSGLPEWMLASSAHAWFQPGRLDLPESELQRWRDSGLVEVDLPRKSIVRVVAPESPRNLILVYLESVGLRVIDHPDYPGLMPNLARRVRSQSHVPNLHASGHITIEGIANSQCGTLLPFERGSDSLAGFDGMAEEQPCLGDVLARAGYAQSYLGGAESRFAGKGNFLAAHGYDRILGQVQWREMGLEPRRGTWGLADPDLFEQALIELEALRAGTRPFNLTLLTIGTHLPGFVYEECRPYGSGEEFIEALHCSDQLLEHWLAQVERAGYLDDTLVVITADHHVFPNPEMKRLFGDESVADKRLPLVVLGAGADQTAATDTGASYDLAPTLLDLLDIEHDARFALGRSLLRADAQRQWFPTRYLDVHAGKSISPAAGECDMAAPELPLRRCDKDALMTLLRMQNAAFSSPTPQLDCRQAASAKFNLPDGAGAPLQFLVLGQDQSARFIWRSRNVQASQPGLYVAVFSPEGRLVERRFIPAEETDALQTLPPVPAAHSMLMAWHANSSDASAPAWLSDHVTATDGAFAVAVDTREQVHTLAYEARDGQHEFSLDPATCTLLVQ